MSQHDLDEALAKIRNEEVSDEAVKAAAGRVFRNLFDSTFIAAEPTGKIRGCADMRALMPAYLNRTLSSARALLLEDHVLTCVDCRHALDEARTGAPAVRPIPIRRPQRARVPMLVWAAAATLLLGIGLGLTGHLPGQNTVNATVASFQGTIYKVTDTVASVVEAGQILKNTDELRTAKGSHAILRLAGGTMVEIGERSEVSLSGGWRGTSLNLTRGQMIVDTRNQTAQSLTVTSGEMTIPITSGIVAVDHGTKESVVAVAKGSVDAHVGPLAHSVQAGQLYGAELRRAGYSVSSEFAWSQNSAAYTELLNQLAGLQKDIQAIPAPGLRYSSALPRYLPADTYLYVAIPNVGGTITEAKKLFDARLAESEALRQWWQQKAISKNGQFDRMVDQISTISTYLGDEVVVSFSGDSSGANAGPVFIAQVKQPGLEQYVQATFPDLKADQLHMQTINNILVASPNAVQLKRVADVIQQAAPANFTTTPFYAQVAKVYQQGAAYFLAANLEQIAAKSVSNSKTALPAGFDNVQYLVLEKGNSEMSASVSFSGERQGVASWLAAPGPAGSLNFVSPEANFAASVVMKSPRAMLHELIGMAGSADSDFAKGLSDFQSKAGVSLTDDVAAPLGNDVTIAMEGPLTPVVAIEVFDATHLQQTITTLVAKFNQQLSAQAGRLTLSTSTPVNGRTFYSISNSKSPNFAVNYTYADGYLVASTSQANVLAAIQTEQSGPTLAASEAFRAQFPADGFTNFSGMVYSNLGQLGTIAKQLAPAAKQNALAGLISTSGPSLICVYGGPQSISAATKGSFLGFNLGTLIGIQQGKPLNGLIASSMPSPVGRLSSRPTL